MTEHSGCITNQQFRDFMDQNHLAILKPRPGAKCYRLRDERDGEVLLYARTRQECVACVERMARERLRDSL